MCVAAIIGWQVTKHGMEKKLYHWASEQGYEVIPMKIHKAFTKPFFWEALFGDVYYVELKNNSGDIVEAWVNLGYGVFSHLTILWKKGRSIK